jgi:hypothetical protein
VEGLSEFTVVSINDNTIIGAYAVEEQPSGRVIGRNLKMSRSQADMLKFELQRVFQMGRDSHEVPQTN